MRHLDSRRNRALFITFIFRIVALFPRAAWLQHARQPVYMYNWTVVPHFTGLAVHQDWIPILTCVSQKTGFNLQLSIYNSTPEFEVAFLKGEPDFAYMNPYHSVRVNWTPSTPLYLSIVHPHVPESVRDQDESGYGQCNRPGLNE